MKKRLFVLFLVAIPLFCANRTRASRPASIALRKRLHVNPLITDPDTIEVDWGGSFSVDGPFTLPASLRYTPEGHHLYWGKTEFSASFDSLNYDGTATHFGDRATVAATCVVVDSEHFDVAVAPLASVLLRGDSGVRAGGLTIARYDAGRNSAGFSASWLANTLDFGAGYGRKIGTHVTPHVNWQWEKTSGTNRTVSIFEGSEYQVSDPFAVDVSAQHQNVWGGHRDTQIVVGLTISTGRLHRH